MTGQARLLFAPIHRLERARTQANRYGGVIKEVPGAVGLRATGTNGDEPIKGEDAGSFRHEDVKAAMWD